MAVGSVRACGACLGRSCGATGRARRWSNGTPIFRLSTCCSTRRGRRAERSLSRPKPMLALRDLQAAFAAHLKGEDRPDLVEVVVGDTISAAARLRIHRHHVRQSLAGALAATFPTVQAIVGEA